jgi:hypothetical protein
VPASVDDTQQQLAVPCFSSSIPHVPASVDDTQQQLAVPCFSSSIRLTTNSQHVYLPRVCVDSEKPLDGKILDDPTNERLCDAYVNSKENATQFSTTD